MSIRIGILGYGNLGRGVESAIAHNEDMEKKPGKRKGTHCRRKGAGSF